MFIPVTLRYVMHMGQAGDRQGGELPRRAGHLLCRVGQLRAEPVHRVTH